MGTKQMLQQLTKYTMGYKSNLWLNLRAVTKEVMQNMSIKQ